MQARIAPSLKARLNNNATPTDRLAPFVSLADYSPGGLIHETTLQYDGRLRFGPVDRTLAETCPADWLADRTRLALRLAAAEQAETRPILVSAPAISLCHGSTTKACMSAVAEVRGCAQEICLMFEDAALTAAPRDALNAIRQLKGAGFRIGVNALRSWSSLSKAPFMLLIDCVWLSAALLEFEDTLSRHLDELSAAGIMTIASDGSWSASDHYKTKGVTHLFSARGDA